MEVDVDSWFRSPLLLVEAKGVAGLGKAGGDGQAGSDKAGQQVPPEVYMALTYAGTLFLFTLSVPLILYALNKLLNKIEDCFGCGSSARQRMDKQSKLQRQPSQKEPHETLNAVGVSQQQQKLVNDLNNNNNNNFVSANQTIFHPDNVTRQQSQHNQRLNLQLLQQHPKYTQFISMSSIPDLNQKNDNSSLSKTVDLSPPMDVNRQQQQQPPPSLRNSNHEPSISPTGPS